LFRGIRAALNANGSVSWRPDEEKAIGDISERTERDLRYDSKHFDLLVLSGVIFLSAAIPSFEVDASLEELKSINHRLTNVQTDIEKLQQH
jgi:hypothetical protein